MDEMAQIDSYLKRIRSECNLSYLEDIYELYNYVPNVDLRSLLSIYHTQLNNWFSVLNNDLRVEYDDNGNAVYKGGYFHAQDSRDLLEVFDDIDRLRTKCASTPYAFRLVSDSYDKSIRQCRRFVEKSGGSTIPEGFPPIEIIELTPIFQLTTSIAIAQGEKTVYTTLNSVGEGSYARVFSYIDPTYHIPIIVKRARPELDNKELARFKHEYEVLKSLRSPYVVNVFSYDDFRNEYTMEFMDENIIEFIQRSNNKLSLAERKGIIAQICRGLTYVHRKGYLHRDLSLSNVLIKHYEDVDVVKLGDFGLVKEPESTLTSNGSLMVDVR